MYGSFEQRQDRGKHTVTQADGVTIYGVSIPFPSAQHPFLVAPTEAGWTAQNAQHTTL
jgi:hypothetical protein